MDNRRTVPIIAVKEVMAVMANPQGNRGDVADQSAPGVPIEVELFKLEQKALGRSRASRFEKKREKGIEMICDDCGGQISPRRIEVQGDPLDCINCATAKDPKRRQ